MSLFEVGGMAWLLGIVKAKRAVVLLGMREMVVHVADLLKLPSLKLAHTIAGVRGLNREVEYIDVLESPDIETLVKPKVLYLSRGFIFRDDELLQGRVISQLAAAGAAGLILEHGRYLGLLPAVMVEEANRICFPVLELPRGVAFADIIREGLALIVAEWGGAVRRYREIQQCLTRIAGAGGDLSRIAQILADLTENTVIIADDKFSLLSFAFWTKAAGKHDGGAYKDNTLEQYLYNLLRTGFVDKIRQKRKPGRVEVLFSKQGEQAWVVVPVQINDDILGYIAVLENCRKLQDADQKALEQASGLTAVAIYKKIAEEEVLRRQRNSFLRRILQEKDELGPLILEQAERLRLPLNQKLVVVLIALVNLEEFCISNLGAHPNDNGVTAARLLDMIAAQIESRQKGLLLTYCQDKLTVLCPVEDRYSQKQILAQVKQIKREIQLFSSGLVCAVGISRTCESYRSLPEAYQEAQEALTIGSGLAAANGIHFFADLGVYQLLAKFNDKKELTRYYHSVLGKLEKADAENHNDFLKTLEAYFGANANIYRAARNLYLHRNSMKYRLERIKEILGVDLDDPEVRFNLQLALKIRRLL